MPPRPEYPTSIRIPRDTREWLKRLAREHRQTMTQAILYAVDKGRAKIEEEGRIADMISERVVK